ncbi:MAG: hypothetical protein JXA37_07270 [Chloroflexia bacterium]|nr:hypothetical protein [Chloroflexia bacterium]
MPEYGEALSDREIEVLRLVATGATNQQIAQELFISVNTVKAHLRNIFAKLDVNSRTEASLEAIREGWVAVEAEEEEQKAGEEETPAETENPESAAAATELIPTPTVQRWPRWIPWVVVSILLITLALSLSGLLPELWSGPTPTPEQPTPLVRWSQRADLPTPRGNFALVPFQDFLYAIGGDDESGVLDTVERFDPVNNNWTPLAAKPTAVSEMHGAVLGGKIYVPGGRDAQDRPIKSHEVYDIERNRWSEAHPLPRSLSNYGLAAFEGELFLFGGWDGTSYRDEILRYDAQSDAWTQVGELPFPWGYPGVVVASNRIFVVGGVNQDGPIDVILEYTPAFGLSAPKPLPGISLGWVQVTSLGDFVFILAQESADAPPQLWQYNVRTQLWRNILTEDPPPAGPYPGGALSAEGTEHFLLMGGWDGQKPAALNQMYQAVYYAVPGPILIAP